MDKKENLFGRHYLIRKKIMCLLLVVSCLLGIIPISLVSPIEVRAESIQTEEFKISTTNPGMAVRVPVQIKPNYSYNDLGEGGKGTAIEDSKYYYEIDYNEGDFRLCHEYTISNINYISDPGLFMKTIANMLGSDENYFVYSGDVEDIYLSFNSLDSTRRFCANDRLEEITKTSDALMSPKRYLTIKGSWCNVTSSQTSLLGSGSRSSGYLALIVDKKPVVNNNVSITYSGSTKKGYSWINIAALAPKDWFPNAYGGNNKDQVAYDYIISQRIKEEIYMGCAARILVPYVQNTKANPTGEKATLEREPLLFYGYHVMFDFDLDISAAKREFADAAENLQLAEEDYDYDSNYYGPLELKPQNIDEGMLAFLEGIFKAITNFKISIDAFFEEGIPSILENILGSFFESSFDIFGEASLKGIFLTPNIVVLNPKNGVQPYQWVVSLWQLVSMISLMLILMGLGMSVFNILTGKNKQDAFGVIKTVLIAFVVAAVSMPFSIYAIELFNAVPNAISANHLTDIMKEEAVIIENNNVYNPKAIKYRVEPTKSNPDEYVFAVGNYRDGYGYLLGQTREQYLKYLESSKPNSDVILTFEDFSGKDLMVIGLMGGENSNNIKFNKEASTSGGAKALMYSVFKAKNGGGGIFVLFIGMLIILAFIIFSVIRFLIICLLMALCPMWCVFAVFQGKNDAIMGWINLFVRSILLMIIFDIAWVAGIYVLYNQASFFGAGRIIVLAIYLLALIGSVKLWFSWLLKAIRHPFTLAGGAVKAHYHRMSESIGSGIENVGRRFGNQSLEHTGGRMSASARERTKIAQERAQGIYNGSRGSSSERIRKAKNDYDNQRMAVEKNLNASPGKTFEMEKTTTTRSSAIDTSALGISAEQFVSIASQDERFADSVKLENGKVYANSEIADDATNFVSSYMVKKAKMEDKDGYHISESDGANLGEIKSSFDNNGVSYKSTVTAQGEELKKQIDSHKAFNELAKSFNSYSPTVVNKGGQEYVKLKGCRGEKRQEIQNATAAIGGSTKFDDHNLYVSKAAITKATEKFNVVKSMETDGSLTSSADGTTFKGDSAQFEKLAEGIENKDSLVVDRGVFTEDEKARAIIKAKVNADDRLTNEATEQFYVMKFDKNRNLQTHLAEIKGYLEEDSSLTGAFEFNKKRELMIKKGHEDEIKGKLDKFMRRTPYWTDGRGGFFYRDKGSNSMTKHLTRPADKGRNCGRK